MRGLHCPGRFTGIKNNLPRSSRVAGVGSEPPARFGCKIWVIEKERKEGREGEGESLLAAGKRRNRKEQKIRFLLLVPEFPSFCPPSLPFGKGQGENEASLRIMKDSAEGRKGREGTVVWRKRRE